ncbi:MAG: DUF4136 domain-containing protein [Planctomycetales bacterium]|nr:DUF4136 domain-containing protein [Planctomycetales bacterium]
MPDSAFDTMIQYGTIGFFTIVVLVILLVFASTTDMGRMMLPNSVHDAVSKLLPNSWITEATVVDAGRFDVQVAGATRLKTVHVRRSGNMTIAWTFDKDQPCPQKGTYSFVDSDHNLTTASNAKPTPAGIQARIETALDETLVKKDFHPVQRTEAGILITAFAAIENPVAVEALEDQLGRDDNTEWKAAVRTAMQHGGAKNPTTIANGSILLSVFEADKHRVLWRAAAIGKIAVDVSEAERERRIRSAVSDMLRQFPPAKPIQTAST